MSMDRMMHWQLGIKCSIRKFSELVLSVASLITAYTG